MVARPGNFLFRAAGRSRADHCGRRRVQSRLLLGATPCILARQHRFCHCRHARRLPPRASLRRRHLLGGIPPRSVDRRHSPCGVGHSLDDRHFRPLGADADIRTAGFGDAADRARAPAFLARARRRQTQLFIPARGRPRPAYSDHAFRPHPARRDYRFHTGERARAGDVDDDRAVDRRHHHRGDPFPAPDLARHVRHGLDVALPAALRPPRRVVARLVAAPAGGRLRSRTPERWCWSR